MKTKPSAAPSVSEYLASLPAPVRRVLRQVRKAIRAAIPGAEERISYGIPSYRLDGRTVIYFAGWKAHYSIYPCTAPLIKAFGKRLDRYEVNNKGTIRFRLDEPVPVELIADMASFRAREAARPQKRSRG